MLRAGERGTRSALAVIAAGIAFTACANEAVRGDDPREVVAAYRNATKADSPRERRSTLVAEAVLPKSALRPDESTASEIVTRWIRTSDSARGGDSPAIATSARLTGGEPVATIDSLFLTPYPAHDEISTMASLRRALRHGSVRGILAIAPPSVRAAAAIDSTWFSQPRVRALARSWDDSAEPRWIHRTLDHAAAQVGPVVISLHRDGCQWAVADIAWTDADDAERYTPAPANTSSFSTE